MASDYINLSGNINVDSFKMRDFTTTLSNSQNATVVSKYKRVFNNFLFADYLVTWTGGSGAGSTFTVSLPPGLTMDTTQLVGGSNTTHQLAMLGGLEATWFISGVGAKFVNALFATTSTIKFSDNTGILLGTGFAAGASLKVRILVPILEWS